MGFFAGNDLEQSALALAVTCYETNALTFLNGERYVAKEFKVTETL